MMVYILYIFMFLYRLYIQIYIPNYFIFFSASYNRDAHFLCHKWPLPFFFCMTPFHIYIHTHEKGNTGGTRKRNTGEWKRGRDASIDFHFLFTAGGRGRGEETRRSVPRETFNVSFCVPRCSTTWNSALVDKFSIQKIKYRKDDTLHTSHSLVYDTLCVWCV